MKSLLKNYIDLLTTDKLKSFAIKNDINLTDNELDYILNLVKENYDDILVNEDKYLNDIKNKIKEEEFIKISNLYTYYKNRYKGYLF